MIHTFKHLFCAILTFLFPVLLSAQVLTVNPPYPTVKDEVIIIFDASQGNAALMDHEGAIYAHTGVILGTTDNPSGWRYVQGEWGTDDPRMRMEQIAKNKYRIEFRIQDFYGIPEEENFLQMAFVFRNQNGSIVAKDSGDADIYYPQIQTYAHGLLEIAGSKGAKSCQTLEKISLSDDGALLLSDGMFQMSIRKYRMSERLEPILRVDCLPMDGSDLPVSEAVIWDEQEAFSQLEATEDGNYVFPLGTHSLVIHPDPIRLEVLSEKGIVHSQELGFFYQENSQGMGPLTGMRIDLQGEESLYGTGSRAIPTNLRGRRLYTYNKPAYGYTWGQEDVYLSIPFVQSSQGCALFFDNYQAGYIDLGLSDSSILECGFKGQGLSYYLIPEMSPSKSSESYTALTGRQPMPPIWALGYIQSRFGYRSQAELDSIVAATIEAGYPLDAVLLDLYWFGGAGKMGDLDWDSDNWPAPKQMIDSLKQQGVQPILITETYVTKESKHFDELDRRSLFTKDERDNSFVIPDFWAGKAALLDIFHPEVSDWFWPKYQQQMELGIEGWWCDSGEPENHPKQMIHTRGSAESVHNLYALYWAKFLQEKYAEFYPQKRLFNLTRSGFAGMQRYSTFPWSGDVSRSWEAFRAQVPIMIGAGLSGIGYMHSDLGGFTGGPRDEELLQRWIQMGSFVPIMRVHGDASGFEPEPIFYSPETQKIAKQAIRFRYQLLPYNYSLAYENHRFGRPLVRPLFYHYPEDERTRELDDQYLWGKHMLIAPVLEKGITERGVYLPAGDWIDLHSGELFEGGREYRVALDPKRIPVFVKGGSILPMASPMQHTGEYTADSLSLVAFTSDHQEIVRQSLYLDDGKTTDPIEKGDFDLIEMESIRKKAKKTMIHLLQSHGVPKLRTWSMTLRTGPKAPKKIRVGKRKLKPVETPEEWLADPSKRFWWVAEQQAAQFSVEWEGEIEISTKYRLGR